MKWFFRCAIVYLSLCLASIMLFPQIAKTQATSDAQSASQTVTTPLSISCQQTIYEGIEFCSDPTTQTYATRINLRNSSVRFKSVLANADPANPNAPPVDSVTIKPVKDMTAVWGAVVGINTDYFGWIEQPVAHHGVEGLFYKDGVMLDNITANYRGALRPESCSASPGDPDTRVCRSSLALSSTNQADIGFGNRPGYMFNAAGGGPIFMRNGQYIAPAVTSFTNNRPGGGGTMRLGGESPFSRNFFQENTQWTVAGLDSSKNYLTLMTVGSQQRIDFIVQQLQSLRVDTALKFDGGGSSQFYYDGQAKVAGSRPVASALLVFSQHVCNSGQYRAEYYNNRTLSGSPTFTRCESGINYDWGSGGPGNGVGNDNFSVRWMGRFTFNTGTYKFIGRADDGIRLWVDGNNIIDAWRDQGATEYPVNRVMSAGEHEVKVEYYENGGGAVAQVRWEAVNTASGNLALNRPAYATSQESATNSVTKGNDGNTGTRWSSQWSATARDEWWWTDLGTKTFDRVVVRWETAYASQHFIGWSDDGIHFTGYWYAINAPGAYAYNLGSHTARYVGMLMRQRAPCCGNYSFWELEAYRTANVASAQTENTETNVTEVTPDGELVTLTLPEAGPENKLFLPLVQR